MDRREWLKGAAVFSGSVLLEACAARHPANTLARPVALPKVMVSAEREIRTTVCLRPFRAPGFRLAAERLGDKLCVHNYGHGGAGITLSWGTGQLATQEVLASGEKQVGVLGCGVVGLSTARMLQQSGKEVTIYSKALPPETTSNTAGGFWSPVMVFDHDRVSPEFREQLVTAARFSYRYFQQFAGDLYAVRWMPVYLVSDEPINEQSTYGRNGPYAGLFPEMHDLGPQEHRFPQRYVRRFLSMLIEPHPYLRALMTDFRLAGGRVVVQELHDLAEIAALPQKVVVNCTGLGARPLFSDDELIPVKGQLTYMAPQPEIEYVVLAGDLYMFPRHDGIVLGGTHVRGDWSLTPDLDAKSRILAGHTQLFSRL